MRRPERSFQSIDVRQAVRIEGGTMTEKKSVYLGFEEFNN